MSGPGPERRRRSTATSSFGVGRREGHDSSGFYDRFTPPVVSDDGAVAEPACVDRIWVGDARDMDSFGDIADASVALMVTSPPYFAGKAYEKDLGSNGVPGSYIEYLQMLEDVFAECVRKLEPGGRMAVNVANLGRKPYRSLSADVIDILSNRLGLLLRGEVVWLKARGAGGNCAWGSFASPANPVLRDLTERIVIASKGRFDRAEEARARAADRAEEAQARAAGRAEEAQARAVAAGQPTNGVISADEFMEATTDVWEIPPESARKVGHPAPFPTELPERLIGLYTYPGELVLDPFMGVGSTAVAAVRTGRHYVGFDTDEDYVEAAKQRVAEERPRLKAETEDFQSRASREGKKAKDMARQLLEEARFSDIRSDVKGPGGVEINFEARDSAGRRWRFDVSGAFTVTQRAGLRRTDTLWKALGKAAVLHEANQSRPSLPLVLLTTDRPSPGSAGDRALAVMCGPDKPIRAIVEMGAFDAATQLQEIISSN